MGGKRLSTKQNLFIKHYIANGGNGTQAAISAGYSPKTAGVAASKLLKSGNVPQHVDKAVESVGKSIETSAEKTISMIADMAYSPHSSEAIKLKALELLGKTQRIFVERHEVDHGLKVSKNIEDIFDSLCILVKLKEERGEE